MTRAEREAFLADLHVGVLAVAGAGDDPPLAAPVWYRYEPGGDVLISTGTESVKATLLAAAGRASFCVQHEGLPYQFVTVEGPVAIGGADEAERERIAIRYLGAEMAAGYMASTAGESNVLGAPHPRALAHPGLQQASRLLIRTTHRVPPRLPGTRSETATSKDGPDHERRPWRGAGRRQSAAAPAGEPARRRRATLISGRRLAGRHVRRPDVRPTSRPSPSPAPASRRSTGVTAASRDPSPVDGRRSEATVGHPQVEHAPPSPVHPAPRRRPASRRSPGRWRATVEHAGRRPRVGP